jgi:hypothetical protein
MVMVQNNVRLPKILWKTHKVFETTKQLLYVVIGNGFCSIVSNHPRNDCVVLFNFGGSESCRAKTRDRLNDQAASQTSSKL